jgi:hypothetical protein
MPFPLTPDNFDGQLPEPSLSPVQAQLLDVAREMLPPAGITIRATQALPFGLRLHLGHSLPQPNAETGQLVLYYNQRGHWTSTVPEGAVTPLTQAAAKVLVASGGVPAVPLW